MADRVGVEQVVRARIVLVDALLHQPHAEDAGIEVEVLLRWPCDGGDVMKPSDAFHCFASRSACSVDHRTARRSIDRGGRKCSECSAAPEAGISVVKISKPLSSTVGPAWYADRAPDPKNVRFGRRRRAARRAEASVDLARCGEELKGDLPMANRTKVTQQKRARERAKQERQQEKTRRREEAKSRQDPERPARQRRRSRHRRHHSRSPAQPMGRRAPDNGTRGRVAAFRPASTSQPAHYRV